jgi:GH43 family beta-xylosidase
MMKKVSFSTLGMKVEWEKYYGKENDEGVSLIKDGNKLYLLSTTSSTGINSSITLITTDAEGDNPIYSEIGEGTQLSASSFQKTSDNGFVIAGTNKHSDNDQSMALIKLKSSTSLW